jgi:glycosyltransferase involved in cell wall biosynthesis
MRGDISPDRVPLYMNAADCLLVTSDYEGSPYIVKEAIACNLPVVSVDAGDIRQQLEPVAPSRIVSSRDAEELGRAVTEILKLQRRTNGWQHIQQFSQEREAGKIVAIYEQVLGNGSGRKIVS